MARPYSEGRLQYFPMDCVMNDAMKLLEAEFGLTAFAVVVKLWQKIYAGRGYYCEWTREVALVFAQECGLGANVVSEIVASAFKRGIFDKGMYDRYGILTSDGVQRRYFEAVKRRKRVEVDERFLLVSVAHTEVNADNNEVNDDINSVNACDNAQSKSTKVEVRKYENNERDIKNESTPPDGAYARRQIEELLKKHPEVRLSPEETDRIIAEMGSASAAEFYIKKFAHFLEDKGARVRDHCGTMLKWYREDKAGQKIVYTGGANEEKKRYDYAQLRKHDREYLKRLAEEG